ncbi:hypothetical protein ACCT20_33390 [Rhizobium ruizarguesonis]|nr:hypothetical protein [Rhizobium ruizarguesonis]
MPYKAFTDLPAAQSTRNVGMVDNDQFFTSATVGHLCFDAIDDDAVSPLRGPILPFNRLADRWGSLLRTLSVRQSNLSEAQLAFRGEHHRHDGDDAPLLCKVFKFSCSGALKGEAQKSAKLPLDE